MRGSPIFFSQILCSLPDSDRAQCTRKETPISSRCLPGFPAFISGCLPTTCLTARKLFSPSLFGCRQKRGKAAYKRKEQDRGTSVYCTGSQRANQGCFRENGRQHRQGKGPRRVDCRACGRPRERPNLDAELCRHNWTDAMQQHQRRGRQRQPPNYLKLWAAGSVGAAGAAGAQLSETREKAPITGDLDSRRRRGSAGAGIGDGEGASSTKPLGQARLKRKASREKRRREKASCNTTPQNYLFLWKQSALQ